MFLCKRVRSEMGVDSVGVGGGELGQGLLPVGGDLSLDESALGPARVGGRVLLLGALRGPAVRDVADRQPQQFDRRLVGGEVAAVLGDWSAWRSSDCGFWWSQAACFRLFSSCSASLGVRYPSAEWSRV